MNLRTVSINVQSIAVRGSASDTELRTLYSTDGSDPKTQYTGPFEVDKNTVVKAVVYRGDQLLFQMQEHFGPKEGLYWGDSDEGAADLTAATTAGGEQAEDVVFENARIATNGKGFHGKGYLDFGTNSDGYVEWYQENDGDAYVGSVAIRYSCKSGKQAGRKMKLLHNGKVVDASLLFPNTKNWGSDWATVDVKVKIERGGNTIRLQTIEGGGPYIDELSVK